MNIGIYGYGNLGRGVECAICQNDDMSLFGVFTRRDPKDIKTLTGAKVFSSDDILNYKDDIDVMIICGGSATDLPEMTPSLAKHFNVVDSFDTHKKIPEHFANVDEVAKKNNNTAIISGGWDPGMFSLARIYSQSILPIGETYTFWGTGVSQGHSDAIRRIEGVLDARQYTVPIESAISKVRNAMKPEFSAREMHKRECYVVAKDGADKKRIEKEIKEMPNYFAEYDTTVSFITMDEMKKNHFNLPHGGVVIRSGRTGFDSEMNHTIEYKLNLDSNPQFTANVLAVLSRALYKMNKRGETGCYTIFDIRPSDLSLLSPEKLREKLL